MSAAIDKSRIIAAIYETDDERILFAIERLLQIEEENVPEWHREVIEQRWKDMQEGKAEFLNWEEVKDNIFKKQNGV